MFRTGVTVRCIPPPLKLLLAHNEIPVPERDRPEDVRYGHIYIAHWFGK